MNLQNEPSVIIGGIIGFAAALVSFLVAFGLGLSLEQQAAILGLVAVVAPVIAGGLIRYRVFAPDTVQRLTDEAYVAGLPPSWPPPILPSPPADNK